MGWCLGLCLGFCLKPTALAGAGAKTGSVIDRLSFASLAQRELTQRVTARNKQVRENEVLQLCSANTNPTAVLRALPSRHSHERFLARPQLATSRSQRALAGAESRTLARLPYKCWACACVAADAVLTRRDRIWCSARTFEIKTVSANPRMPDGPIGIRSRTR